MLPDAPILGVPTVWSPEHLPTSAFRVKFTASVTSCCLRIQTFPLRATEKLYFDDFLNFSYKSHAYFESPFPVCPLTRFATSIFPLKVPVTLCSLFPLHFWILQPSHNVQLPPQRSQCSQPFAPGYVDLHLWVQPTADRKYSWGKNIQKFPKSKMDLSHT